jgi:hypothetical protein
MARSRSGRARSAKTGRFVKAATVKRSPSTTVVHGSFPARGTKVSVARSAVTGRFIRKSTAQRNPAKTIVQTVKK